MNADEIPLFVDGAEKFLDMFQSAGMGIFSDVPSRMLPYMEHRRFHPEEIEAIKRMSESDAVSLSAIISSDDPEESSEAAGRLMSKAGPEGSAGRRGQFLRKERHRSGALRDKHIESCPGPERNHGKRRDVFHTAV